MYLCRIYSWCLKDLQQKSVQIVQSHVVILLAGHTWLLEACKHTNKTQMEEMGANSFCTSKKHTMHRLKVLFLGILTIRHFISCTLVHFYSPICAFSGLIYWESAFIYVKETQKSRTEWQLEATRHSIFILLWLTFHIFYYSWFCSLFEKDSILNVHVAFTSIINEPSMFKYVIKLWTLITYLFNKKIVYMFKTCCTFNISVMIN